jgi:hypothetical protein
MISIYLDAYVSSRVLVFFLETGTRPLHQRSSRVLVCTYIQIYTFFSYLFLKKLENLTTFNNFASAFPKIGELSKYDMILGSKISEMINY